MSNPSIHNIMIVMNFKPLNGTRNLEAIVSSEFYMTNRGLALGNLVMYIIKLNRNCILHSVLAFIVQAVANSKTRFTIINSEKIDCHKNKEGHGITYIRMYKTTVKNVYRLL
jgi:hypothetical protein